MGLARSFKVSTDKPNQIALNWLAPLYFNDTSDELIVTKTITHFPSELYNSSFPTKATDSRPIEIFRGKTIVGLNTGTISVLGSTLTDTAATFPSNSNLTGRLLRDSSSKVHKIVNNTSTTITVESSSISNGKYVVLPDFPEVSRIQENYEYDIRTVAGNGFITNLVVVDNSQLVVKTYEKDELKNLIFEDGNNNKFIIKSNDETTIYFYENTTPVINVNMRVYEAFYDSIPTPYIDTFLTDLEASNRSGSGLLDNQFYYYTVFTLKSGANVAQAEFSTIDSGSSTQGYAISAKDRDFGDILYGYWPELYRTLDTTEDLEDLMHVFGFLFNELHALVETYKLQDPHTVLTTALLPLSEQTGLPSVGFSIGADTLRRIAKDLISCWHLKGSKEGIYQFIKMITTWDITDGTADISSAIQDILPNVSALRFFDANLGSTNVRLTETDPLLVPGGRFARSLPGIVIPGFFTFREFVINIPNVALYIGTSESFVFGADTTTVINSSANFGANNSLVGNFLLPNQEEYNDIFQIVSNTATSITVRGIINNKNPGGFYAILSPLNTNRFIILNKLMPFYIPFGSKPGYEFT